AGNNKSVVIAGTSVIDLVDECEILAERRILENQRPSLIRIRGRRTYWVAHAVQRAWSEPEEQCGIDGLNSPKVGGIASEIACREQPGGSNLSLHTQIPLGNRWILRLEVHNGIRRIQREGCV